MHNFFNAFKFSSLSHEEVTGFDSSESFPAIIFREVVISKDFGFFKKDDKYDEIWINTKYSAVYLIKDKFLPKDRFNIKILGHGKFMAMLVQLYNKFGY